MKLKYKINSDQINHKPNNKEESSVDLSQVLTLIIDAITFILFITTLIIPVLLLITAVYHLLISHSILIAITQLITSIIVVVLHQFIKQKLSSPGPGTETQPKQ